MTQQRKCATYPVAMSGVLDSCRPARTDARSTGPPRDTRSPGQADMQCFGGHVDATSTTHGESGGQDHGGLNTS